MKSFIDFITKRKHIIVSDLDNCFSDSRDVRFNTWDEFEENLIKYAKPNYLYIKRLIDYCNYNKEIAVFFVTSRENTEDLKNFSLSQIINYSRGFFRPKNYSFSYKGIVVHKNCNLYMRNKNDFRKSYEVKLDIFKSIEKDYKSKIDCIIDDEIENINQFVKAGYKSILYDINTDTYKEM